MSQFNFICVAKGTGYLTETDFNRDFIEYTVKLFLSNASIVNVKDYVSRYKNGWHVISNFDGGSILINSFKDTNDIRMRVSLDKMLNTVSIMKLLNILPSLIGDVYDISINLVDKVGDSLLAIHHAIDLDSISEILAVYDSV